MWLFLTAARIYKIPLLAIKGKRKSSQVYVSYTAMQAAPCGGSHGNRVGKLEAPKKHPRKLKNTDAIRTLPKLNVKPIDFGLRPLTRNLHEHASLENSCFFCAFGASSDGFA